MNNYKKKEYEVAYNTHKFDYYLLLAIIILTIIGLLFVSSSSSYLANLNYNKSNYFFYKQLKFVVFGGFTALIIGMRIDFYYLKKMIRPSMFVVMFLLLLTHFPSLGGITSNGASGWYKVPIINFIFQPSEIAKIIFILYISNILSNDKYTKLGNIDKFITAIPLICAGFIIVFQPDMGSTFVITLSIVSIYLAFGIKIFRPIPIFIFIASLLLFSFIISNNPYMMDRVFGFTNPWIDPKRKGYQLIQSLYAIGSGGLTGRGYGESIQKRFYLPEAHTDFIFSIMCEEEGFLFSFLFMVTIFFIAYRGYSIAINSKDSFLKLLATGITTLITWQSLTNIGVAIGLLPTTGLTLPFISYGGTAIIIEFFCIGLLLNISMYTTNKWYSLKT